MVGLIDVGQVVPARVAPGIQGGDIEKLLESADFATLAAQTWDPRLSPLGWEHCLRYELAMLVNWLARRTLASYRAGAGESGSAPSSVLTLLPRYGFALHALRRSIPFAALGIPTTISVPPESQESARSTIPPLLRALELQELVTLSEAAPPKVVERAVAEGVPVFVTGRLDTWRHLTERYPDAHIIGSTGECAVVLSCDPAAAEGIVARLADRALPISCTNHQLTLITADPLQESATVLQTAGSLSTAQPGTVADELRRAHPSVVLIPEDRQQLLPDASLAGYRAVQCDSFGVASTTVGFGRDPVAGWPGDHCV
jgi:hypothetical protein